MHKGNAKLYFKYGAMNSGKSTILLQTAHKLEEMKTICRCGNKAMFNARFLDGHIVTDGDQVLIDGSSKITYESVCPSCYYKLKENEKKLIKKRD